MIVPHARIPYDTVLITPVGVVIIAAYQVVDFLGRGILRTALHRGAEYGKAETVTVAKVLLRPEII